MIEKENELNLFAIDRRSFKGNVGTDYYFILIIHHLLFINTRKVRAYRRSIRAARIHPKSLGVPLRIVHPSMRGSEVAREKRLRWGFRVPDLKHRDRGRIEIERVRYREQKRVTEKFMGMSASSLNTSNGFYK